MALRHIMVQHPPTRVHFKGASRASLPMALRTQSRFPVFFSQRFCLPRNQPPCVGSMGSVSRSLDVVPTRARRRKGQERAEAKCKKDREAGDFSWGLFNRRRQSMDPEKLRFIESIYRIFTGFREGTWARTATGIGGRTTIGNRPVGGRPAEKGKKYGKRKGNEPWKKKCPTLCEWAETLRMEGPRRMETPRGSRSCASP
jgi:hypothetical protein